jgi:glycosyltransferase involved in cell wall biosynthesis
MRTIRIVSVVEATTVNAVAKITLEFFRTARELAETKSDVPVAEGSIVTFARGSSENEFIQSVRASGTDIDVIAERGRFDLAVIPALKTIVERRQPDIVVTQSVKSHFLMWRSRLWKQVPWIAYHHGYTTTDSRMRLYNRFDRWSLPKTDVVLTVCNAFARELTDFVGLPPEQIRVRHNAIRPAPAVNPEAIRAVRERLGISANQRVILSVGRLSKEKAQVDLIAAFKQLCEAHSEVDCKLILVGDGPERDSLRTAAHEAGLEGRIIFTGQVTDVRPYYAAADVFVLPSHSEGSPNVLLEAMAAQVPIVATAVGGVPEMVQHEASALLVSPQAPVTMAQAIHQILTDDSLVKRLVANASTLLISNHSPDQYARLLLRLYREVIEARASPAPRANHE